LFPLSDFPTFSHLVNPEIYSISKMMVRPAEEEVDVEVRREDQDNINKFARLNARLQELQEERSIIKVRINERANVYFFSF
jgi:hypothetical protein